MYDHHHLGTVFCACHWWMTTSRWLQLEIIQNSSIFFLFDAEQLQWPHICFDRSSLAIKHLTGCPTKNLSAENMKDTNIWLRSITYILPQCFFLTQRKLPCKNYNNEPGAAELRLQQITRRIECLKNNCNILFQTIIKKKKKCSHENEMLLLLHRCVATVPCACFMFICLYEYVLTITMFEYLWRIWHGIHHSCDDLNEDVCYGRKDDIKTAHTFMFIELKLNYSVVLQHEVAFAFGLSFSHLCCSRVRKHS